MHSVVSQHLDRCAFSRQLCWGRNYSTVSVAAHYCLLPELSVTSYLWQWDSQECSQFSLLKISLYSRSVISSLALPERGKGQAMEHICSPPAVALKEQLRWQMLMSARLRWMKGICSTRSRSCIKSVPERTETWPLLSQANPRRHSSPKQFIILNVPRMPSLFHFNYWAFLCWFQCDFGIL